MRLGAALVVPPVVAALVVLAAPDGAQAHTAPIMVAMSSPSGGFAENGGTADVIVTLDRAPTYGGKVTVPLTLRGAVPGRDFSMELHSSSDTGAVLATEVVLGSNGGRRQTRNPELRFSVGARRAVLRFTGVDNSRRTQPVVWLAFGWGDRAPHGDKDPVAADPARQPAVLTIIDDETGPLTVPLDSPLRPAGVAAGNTFRLLLVTSRGTEPGSDDIGFYNRMAQGLVARRGLTELRPYAGMVRVLGSTSTVDARDNTGTNPASDGPGHPVYWLRGAKVADDYADLFDGEWDNYSGDAASEDGAKLPGWIRVWTGSTTSGAADAGGPLGNGPDSDGKLFVRAAWANHRDGLDPLSFGTVEETDNRSRNLRFGHRYYVMSPVFTVESDSEKLQSGPVKVTMSAPPSDVDEAAGTKDITVALSRSLADDETVTVPIRVTGATATADYTLGLHGAHPGATLLSGGAFSAQAPAVLFEAGASSAVLRFDPVDNSMRTQPWVTIAHGASVEAVGVDVAAPEGGPISFAITDDETGDIVVPHDWSLRPTHRAPGMEFRLLFATSAKRDAASSEIADYDEFVRRLAARGHPDIVPYAGFFKVLGGTPTVAMDVHNGIDPAEHMHLYWLGGHNATHDRVAGSYAQFLDNWIRQARPRPRTEHGALAGVEADGYWTGVLGGHGGRAGVGFLHQSAPLSGGQTRPSDSARSLFGLSPVFKVAPPPTAAITPGGAIEAGEVASFTIRLDPAPLRDTPINLLVGWSGFVASQRQGIKYGAVTVGAGEASADFVVPTHRAPRYAGDTPVNVWLLRGDGYRIGHTDNGAKVAVIRNGPPVKPPPTPVEPTTVEPPPIVEPPVIVDPPTVDEDLPAASFERSSSAASEFYGLVNVAIGLDPLPESEITFNYTVSGSAEAGADYRRLSGTVNLPPFVTRFTIPIGINDDPFPEFDETLILTINGGEGYILGDTLTHTLTIMDND